MMSCRWSEYRLRRRVQFYELDAAGIVHFAWYFRYMQEAEDALWREAGLIVGPPRSPIGLPRVNVSFDFHKPLRVEEEFDIHIRVIAIGEKSIRYTCVLVRDGVKIATGSATLVCVTRDECGVMKSMPIPREIADRLEVATVEA